MVGQRAKHLDHPIQDVSVTDGLTYYATMAVPIHPTFVIIFKVGFWVQELQHWNFVWWQAVARGRVCATSRTWMGMG